MKFCRYFSLLTASLLLLGTVSNASAEITNEVLAEGADQNVKLTLFRRSGGIPNVNGYGIKLEPSAGLTLVSKTRPTVGFFFNGVRVFSYKLRANATKTKAERLKAFGDFYFENVNRIRAFYSAKVQTAGGEVSTISGAFDFDDVPNISSVASQTRNSNSCRVGMVSSVSVSIAEPKIELDRIKGRLSTFAAVSGLPQVDGSKYDSAIRACEMTRRVAYETVANLCTVDRSRIYNIDEYNRLLRQKELEGCPGGCCSGGLLMKEVKDCSQSVNQQIAELQNPTSCSFKVGFHTRLNGVSAPAGGAFNRDSISSYSMNSDRVELRPNISREIFGDGSKDLYGMACANGQTRRHRYYLSVMESGVGPNLYLPHLFMGGEPATAELFPASEVYGRTGLGLDAWHRTKCSDGSKVTIQIAAPSSN